MLNKLGCLAEGMKEGMIMMSNKYISKRVYVCMGSVSINYIFYLDFQHTYIHPF